MNTPEIIVESHKYLKFIISTFDVQMEGKWEHNLLN